MKCLHSTSSPEKKALRMQTFAIHNVGIKGKQDISRVSVYLKVSIEEKVQIAPKICQVFDTKKPHFK